MAATDQMPDPKKALAPREPSTHGSSNIGGATSMRGFLASIRDSHDPGRPPFRPRQ